jgi:hypothetical protein
MVSNDVASSMRVALVRGTPLDSFAIAAFDPASQLYSKDALIPVTVLPDYALSLQGASGLEARAFTPPLLSTT